MLVGIVACTSSHKEEAKPALFTSLPASHTHIDFINQLDYNKDFNIYTYRNFYNGGGVALGDINNDGLLDVYFTANMQPNRLYLNKGHLEGHFKFEDITEKAGVAGEQAWSTGVSMADVNGDGWLDIYVCNSGDIEGDNKQNELFINNGAIPGRGITFTEKAEEYGIADRGYSTHAAFFDYDKDGDLDCYLLNNSYQAIGSFNLRRNQRPIRDSVGGDKLYRNDTPLSPLKGEKRGVFTDVSEEAGIYGSVIGFGLGVTVGDVNRDGWQDIFVSNDFFERDYLYLNQQDSTFKECLEEQMHSISLSSMGADMADINNDGYPEIFVTEMLPEDDARLKTKTTFENWDKYQYNLKNGYYHQFTRNMLHLNNGNNTFSEIGRLAGVHATDWSWGALMADMDNDGMKDIFVANGIFQDLTDQDYIQFISNEQTVKSVITKEGVDFEKLIDAIPSERISNYMFINEGDYKFINKAEVWGLAAPSHSNGSAYGDLDNDGDLDLVVNNVNMPAFVYRNEADSLLENHYLRVVLQGAGKNTFAIGAQVTVKAAGQQFYVEQMPMRGFQSSVDPRLHFGLGNITEIDSLEVLWPDGRQTILIGVGVDQQIELHQQEALVPTKAAVQQTEQVFAAVADRAGIDFVHQENAYVDFDRDRLLFHMHSQAGPCLSKADVNGDELEDFYVGGAKGQAGALYVQQADGSFKTEEQAVFVADSNSEDVASIFFDADGDADADLYVGSGGSEFSNSSAALLDRLYFNDGRGAYRKSKQLLPSLRSTYTGAVAASDYDGDGDIDLFVGSRMRPLLYGVPADSYLLANDGRGHFTDVTDSLAPALKAIGMVTASVWTDINGDGDQDLVVAGDWMAVRVLENEGGRLVDRTGQAGLSKTQGWWNSLVAADVDEDGDMDLVAGNHGLNSRFKASEAKPLSLWVNDFDGNGTAEQIISIYNGEQAYPLVLRHDLLMQLPSLKKKYLKYASYKHQRVEDIFTQEQLQGAVKVEAYWMETSLLLNNGSGSFTVKALPVEAQFSPVYGIVVEDFDQDGHQDILLAGNFYAAKPEVGRYDASYGLYLTGDGRGNFEPVSAKVSGIKLQGEVRALLPLQTQQDRLVLVAHNDDSLRVVKYHKRESTHVEKR